MVLRAKGKYAAFGIVWLIQVPQAWAGTTAINLAGGNNMEMSDDGGMYTYFNNDEDNFESWDGKYNGEGYT